MVWEYHLVQRSKMKKSYVNQIKIDENAWDGSVPLLQRPFLQQQLCGS